MKTLIATAAIVTALASPSFALSPQAAQVIGTASAQGTTEAAQLSPVRYRSHRVYRGARRNSWCQGARDPRDPYICNYMGHYN